MKKYSWMMVIGLLLNCITASAQKSSAPKNMIAAALHIPLGDFSTTHFGGIGISYAPANIRYRLLHTKWLGLQYETGGLYYAGKKQIVSGYGYRYKSYIGIFAMGGLSARTGSKSSISVYAGPGISVYYSVVHFNWFAQAQVHHWVSKRISLAPGLLVNKRKGTDALWSVFFKVGWAF